jgi:hypothetical protein
MKRDGVVGSQLVGEDDSSILVCWRNVQPSSLTAYSSILVCWKDVMPSSLTANSSVLVHSTK